MREVAKHLEAMGRHGDATLVHMSPQEVSALHGIASINGTHLTTNPHTGLPEAFSLGGFFKSLLPTIVGAVAAPLTGGTSMLIPVMAGAATGAALNGKDPLMGALMGGLGGYGGAGIGNALSAGSAASTAAQGANTASNAATAAANQATGQAAAKTLSNVANPLAEGSVANALAQPGVMGSGSLYSGFPQGVAGGVQGMVGGPSGAAQLSSGVQTAASTAAPSGLSSLTSGLKSLGTEAGRDAFVQSLGGTGPNADLIAAGKVAMPLGMAGLAGIEPPQMPQEKEYKYDPYATLNLNTDSGLRFFAEGGDVNETPDPDSNPAEYQSGRYGVPMLNKSVGGIASFARGGYLDGPGDGMSDSIPATIEGKQPARLADGEFIVPADVVSHLGNGSTKAGAQRLYSMMDKIRHARTGTTKQGKQINPKKYLPA
jgi:hypothetical protein